MSIKYLIPAIFLLFAGSLIYIFGPLNLLSNPASEVTNQATKPIGPLIRNHVFVQEMTMKRDYLQGIDLLLATWARPNKNKNIILVADHNKRVIFSETVFSKTIKDNEFHRIQFDENKYIGKGNKVYLYVYSPDGSVNNNITIWIDSTSTFGRLYQLILNDSVSQESHDPGLKILNGSMIVKTYQGNYGLSLGKLFNYLIIIILALVLCYIISPTNEINIKASKFYFIVSLLFGTIYTFITPPFQVPDEPVHFFRGYQISDFDFLQLRQEVPKSLHALSQKSFSVPEKSYRLSDFRDMMNIEHTMGARRRTWSYWYIVPYIPQGIGISIGRLFNFNVLGLMYMGRIFNLLFSVILITLSIHYIPIFKWGMVLLGCMPMTLTQLSSNSYDALTIGLAMFAISYFLHLKFSNVHSISKLNIFILFATNILLAFCRPVYSCIGFLFLVIPVVKIGSVRRYIYIFIILLISITLAPFLLTIVRILIASPSNPLIPIPWKPPLEQIDFMVDHFPAFIKIFFNTIFVLQSDFYMESFVGILGWVDNPVPHPLVYGFLLILLLVSIFNSTKEPRLSIYDRLIFLSVFIISFVAIEVAIYITWSPVGNEIIAGVQGRYFIPIASMFFIALCNGNIYCGIRNFVSYFITQIRKTFSFAKLPARWMENSVISMSSIAKALTITFIIYTLSVTIFIIFTKYYIR